MTEPIGYLNFGWSYLRAAECVARAAKPGDFNGPTIMRVGHSVELMLKSYLWHAVDEKSARGFGHRIGHPLAEAKSRGLRVACSDHELSAFDHLDKLVSGQPYEARYLVTGAKCALDANSAISFARKLMDAIEPTLAPERVRNVGKRTDLEPSQDSRSRSRPPPGCARRVTTQPINTPLLSKDQTP